MVKKHPTDAEYVQMPNPMEVRGDSVRVQIVGSYKPNYFGKRVGVLFQPELEYEGGKLQLHPMLLKGQSAKNLEGTVINKKHGGTFTYTENIPYSSQYKNARLVVNPVAFPAQSLLAAQTAIAWYPGGVILDKNQTNQGQTLGSDTLAQNRASRIGAMDPTTVQSVAAANATTNPRSRRDALALNDARELGEKVMATGVRPDTTPPIQWYYSIEQSEDDPENAVLVAKAVIRPGFELISEKKQEDPFKATIVNFKESPDDYEKTGEFAADKQPLQKTVSVTMNDGSQKQIPVTYYRDSVTFRQPIKVKNKNDFQVLADADYVLNDNIHSNNINPKNDFIAKRPDEQPGLIPVAGKGEEKDAIIRWIYSIEYSPDDPEKATLVAKAILRNGFELPSEKAQQDPFKATVVQFKGSPNDYEKTGAMVTDKQPSQKNVTITAANGRQRQVPLSYYADSVTFRQPIKIKGKGDFEVLADADYVLNNNSPTKNADNAKNILAKKSDEQPTQIPVFGTGESLKDGTSEWSYSIERSEDDPTRAFIVAKAILKDGYEMPADKAHENLDQAAAFLFDSADDYELAGNVIADPTAKTKNITTIENGKRKVTPVSYYKDSVTLRQPIRLKNVDDFDILGDAGYIINNIYYGYDQADFLSEGSRELDLLIAIAMKNPSLKFELTAHTDERGTEAYNAALSQRRLVSVTEYIRKKGLDMNRVITRAAGKTEPQFRNAASEEEHALNRRTTVRMFDPNKAESQTRIIEVMECNPFEKQGLSFRVQVGAFREMPKYPLYFFRDHLNAAPGMNLTYYRDRDGLYKFTLGDFTNLEQARRLSQRILDAKKDAHVVAFMDEKSISVAEAEAIVNQRQE
jgi:outer membrane protein OmpA-like peptidoglycan-associated protein